jgi:peptidylprolyl isomerase
MAQPQAQPGTTVRVHYTGRLEDDRVFDSSTGGEPLEFTVGEGRVIPGFEQAVVGMQVGEKRTITIPPEQAYGPRDDEMIAEVERDKFPPDIAPEVGQQLQMKQQGQTYIVTVAEVTDETVKLDANHPLAGKELIFDVELVEVA